MVERYNLCAKKLGVVFGTFAPLHQGHIDLIQQAKRANDGAVVIVSGYGGDRGDVVGLDLLKRFRYVRETFADDSLIKVVCLDETGMPRYPDGWSDWLSALRTLVKDAAPYHHSKQVTVYMSEMEYQEAFQTFLPDWHVTLLNRDKYPISGSMIRNNPYFFWQQIAGPFKRHFSRNVLVIGSASSSKTSLVKDLGRLYNAAISLEYAREYQKKYNVTNEELNYKDYIYLLTEQYRQTSDVIDGSQNHGLVIADTNSLVTMAYIDFYLKGKIPERDYQVLYDLYLSIVRKEKWDLILMTRPLSVYVDDGFRDMDMSDKKIRDDFSRHLEILIKQVNWQDKLVFLGEQGETYFSDVYTTAKNQIDILITKGGLEA